MAEAVVAAAVSRCYRVLVGDRRQQLLLLLQGYNLPRPLDSRSASPYQLPLPVPLALLLLRMLMLKPQGGVAGERPTMHWQQAQRLQHYGRRKGHEDPVPKQNY